MGLRRQFSRDTLYIIGLMALGFLLRFDFLLATNFRIDADEAIVGLMAKHIVEGSAIPTFYYGQHYMGSFEALLVAQLFKLFGVSSVSLKLVPLFFSILLIPLIYAITFRLGGRTSARIAALFMAIPPASLVLWSSMARGGFAEIIFFGALATLLSLRWLNSENTARGGTFLCFMIWFLFGAGWWINNQILYFMLPIALVGALKVLSERGGARSFIGRLMALLQQSVIALSAFFIGGLPYWIYNLQYDFVSLEMFNSASSSHMGEHLSGLFTLAIPMILGAIRFWSNDPVFPGAVVLAYVLYVVPVLFIGFRLRGAILQALFFKVNRDKGLLAVFGVFVAILAIFSISEFGYLVTAPRYLLPLYVPLFVLCGIFLGRIYRITPIISSLWIGAIVCFNLASSYLGGRAVGGEPHVYSGQRVSVDHTELIEWLKAKNYTKVHTNYWIGYRLAFETKEQVTFIVFQAPHQVRIESYENDYDPTDSSDRWSRDIPYVLVPTQAERVKNALQALGLEFQVINLSGYSVVYGIRPPDIKTITLNSDQFTVQVTHNEEAASFAFDADLKTRWGSAKPQNGEMGMIVKFNRDVEIAGFRYDLGEWKHDYPRGLKSEVILSDGSKKELFDQASFDDIFYLLDRPNSITIKFPPAKIKEIHFEVTGAHPLFDWSIAELTFLAPAPVQ